jgi:hypothetical protein
LLAMPTAARAVSVEQARVAIAGLKQTEHYSMSSVGCQHTYELILEVLSDMELHVSPDENLANGKPVLAKFFEHAKHFVRASKGSENLSGQAAMQHFFQQMQSTMDRDTSSRTLPDLEIFQSNQWMVSPEQKSILSGWVGIVCREIAKNDAGAKNTARSTTSRSSGSGSGAHSSSPTKFGSPDEKMITSKQNILKFFRKA